MTKTSGQMPATLNETSFAVEFGHAVALTLDAIALTGAQRRVRLGQAQDRLYQAFGHTITPEELALANGLNQTLKDYDRNGMSW